MFDYRRLAALNELLLSEGVHDNDGDNTEGEKDRHAHMARAICSKGSTRIIIKNGARNTGCCCVLWR